jgi:AcrR family transcriptional regulator
MSQLPAEFFLLSSAAYIRYSGTVTDTTMGRSNARVKRKRPYDSTSRRRQAERTRALILDAALRLFLTAGYATTTIAAIAAAAGVSVETIYKSFGSKPALVRALSDRALAGAGPRPAYERSDEMRAQETDPHKIIDNWGTLTTEVAPLVSPIHLVVRAAAEADPDLARLRDDIEAARLERMTVNARHLHDAGHLRPGVSLAAAADVLWTYSSPELYELLVLRRGWSTKRYGKFVADAMIAELLPANTSG